MVTPERREKATERKESSWGKDRAYGQTHPTEDCKEERCAEFNTSWGTELGSNEKVSWMQSTTAVWAGCWQGLLMAAVTLCCFFSVWVPPIRFVPLQSTKTIHTLNLFSSVSSRLAMDLWPTEKAWEQQQLTAGLCSQELTKTWQMYPAETAWHV